MHGAQIRVEWDPKNKKEIEESKKIYQQAKKEYRKIVDLDGQPISCFKPELLRFLIKAIELKEGQFELRFFDETGDRRLIWDSKSRGEIKEASKIFEDYIKKGWRAYAISKDGKLKNRIRSFNADTEEIIFDEESLKNTFKEFVKTFTEVKMLPATRPS